MKSDFTCKSCPSNCEKCNDDGNGVGVCTNCYAGYTVLSDANSNAADGTKCLSKSVSGDIVNYRVLLL